MIHPRSRGGPTRGRNDDGHKQKRKIQAENREQPELKNGMHPRLKALLISAAITIVCGALILAYQSGFRVIDGFGWRPRATEAMIPSPAELLILFGTLTLGAVSGLATFVLCLAVLFRKEPSKGATPE
jgi:hypothetical protein